MTVPSLTAAFASGFRSVASGSRQRAGQPAAYQVIPGLSVDPARVGRLMRAADEAVLPGSPGMRGTGASSSENEWVLVRLLVHEAAHAVIAQRWGADTRIEIGRGTRFGLGVCHAAGLASASDEVKRQFGLAGLLGELQAEEGGSLTLTQSIEAVRRGPFSDGDWRLIRGSASPREIDVCQRRLQHQWADVIDVAREHLAAEMRHYQVRLS